MQRIVRILLLNLCAAGALLIASPVVAQRDCGTIQVTPVNGMQDITVSTTAIRVARQNTARCSLAIINKSGGDVRCAPTAQGTPTISAGYTVEVGASVSVNAATDEWFCIREEGSDGVVTILEERP